MKIGIYPGSFDPVHKEHIKIVDEILNLKIVDQVLIVPTGNYWNKNISASLNDRINMLKFYEKDNIKIETKFNDTPSTYELITKLEEVYPSDELYLIVGGDNIKEFDKWINYQKLLLHPFIIVEREECDRDMIEGQMKKFNKENYYIININSTMSSSSVRATIAEGKKTDFIDEKVFDYIEKNFLYKN